MNEDFLNLIHNARQLKASLPIVEPQKILITEKYADDILPFDLYKNTRQNIERISDQINKSFYYEIYDGAAILMRRLIEMLLILAFKRRGQEASIRGSDGNYLQLSEIINCAIQNRQLDLSRNAKAYLGIFKETGDLSAHNPFHNCRKKDLELIQHKFRSLVEELFYKAGILT